MDVLKLIDYCEEHAPAGYDQDKQDLDYARDYARKDSASLGWLLFSWNQKAAMAINPVTQQIKIVFYSKHSGEEGAPYMEFANKVKVEFEFNNNVDVEFSC